MNKKKLAKWVVPIGSTALVIAIASVIGNEGTAQAANPNKAANETNTQSAIGAVVADSNSSLKPINSTNISDPTNNGTQSHPTTTTSSTTNTVTAQTQTPVQKSTPSAPVAAPKRIQTVTPTRFSTPKPAPAPIQKPRPVVVATPAPAPTQVQKHTRTGAS